MTSIISPHLGATVLASTAQTKLAEASHALRQPPRSTDPTVPTIGLPLPHAIRASNLASAAVADIDRALGLALQLSAGTITAFTNARNEAQDGVDNLGGASNLPVGRPNPGHVALQFDAAGLWLGLAKNLIALTNGTAPIAQPPVTTLPIKDGPTGPVTLPSTPIPPITIQLPDPGSPIQ